MKKLTLALTLIFTIVLCSAQTKHNLDFEVITDNKAKNWEVFGNGNHKIDFDDKNAQNGTISGVIEDTTGSEGFKALAYTIPADFGGKRIKLTGYLKTENVEGGFAGLWLRVDPNIAFDNMASKKIQGSNDWTKYEIE